MALKFFNIRSGETLVADTEPKIAALWASSDHSPNITQGQDFGWRLAPEINVELKRMKQDITLLERIADRFKKGLEDLTEIDLLHWISNRTALENAPQAQIADYQDEYDEQVRRLEMAGKKPQAFDTEEEITTTTTVAPETTTTTTVPETTTTTTVAPDTTTTTTKKS